MYTPTLFAAKILGMGIPELIIILVVVLLIFGPKNLPKLGASLGKTVKNVRDGVEGKDKELDEGELTEEVDEEEGEEEEEPAPKKKNTSKKK